MVKNTFKQKWLFQYSLKNIWQAFTYLVCCIYQQYCITDFHSSQSSYYHKFGREVCSATSNFVCVLLHIHIYPSKVFSLRGQMIMLAELNKRVKLQGNLKSLLLEFLIWHWFFFSHVFLSKDYVFFWKKTNYIALLIYMLWKK